MTETKTPEGMLVVFLMRMETGIGLGSLRGATGDAS